MPESEEQPQFVRIRGGDDAPAAYANVCNISASAEETFLHFAQRDADNPNEAISILKVCLSLPHAKRLARALTQTIITYESFLGEVTADTEDRLAPETRQQLGLPPKGVTQE